MAIVKNFWLKGSKKRLGGAVLYQAMGQTRSRELASEVTNPRTEAQMSQRVKWSNLVNFYRANASWMKYAFETKKQTQSEYNKFMSVNITASRIALTKDMAASGAVVAYPYIITQGSLPSIEWVNAKDTINSNIYINPSETMEDYVSVADFSRALIDNNPALREGDQISLIRVTQMTNAATGYPYIIVRKYEMLLDTSLSLPWKDFLPEGFFNANASEKAIALRVTKTNRNGGFAMVISRTIGGKTYVSTQSLVMVNNEELISKYSSASAIADAISSYGESADAFLSTTSANSISSAPIALTINYATIDGKTYTPGSLTPLWSDIESANGQLVFNDNLPSGLTTTAKAWFYGSEGLPCTNVSISGNKLNITLPSYKQGADDRHLASIVATIGEVDYTIKFASQQSYESGGLD